MENILILLAVLAALVILSKFLQKDKTPSGNCKNCPEYRYCGGGRPRCARRNETLK